MTKLYFTRQFTSGLLKGIMRNDSISFPTAEGCLAWVAAINAKEKRGKVEYRIVDRSFQNYQRT